MPTWRLGHFPQVANIEGAIVGLFVDQVVADFFATNCWIIAPAKNSECVIVDPGIAIPSLVPKIIAKLEESNLKPAAILITHGHLDHHYSLIPLQQDCGAGVLIHKLDRDLLARPERAMGPQGLALLSELSEKYGGHRFTEPESISELSDEEELAVCGMKISIERTPGHTPGSLIARFEDEYLITGDTLFKGSIGRTDLPRGSISEMERSLREKIALQPGELKVLPGHGERTTMEFELTTNPYIKAALEGRLS
jgi:glyoxylase-like metal-dependent hydrolase (beta-lactamase superfamily II)